MGNDTCGINRFFLFTGTEILDSELNYEETGGNSTVTFKTLVCSIQSFSCALFSV